MAIGGDFFPEPRGTPGESSGALEGAPTGLGEEIAARLRETFDPRVEVVGFSPEAVARTVRRTRARARGPSTGPRSGGASTSGARLAMAAGPFATGALRDATGSYFAPWLGASVPFLATPAIFRPGCGLAGTDRFESPFRRLTPLL